MNASVDVKKVYDRFKDRAEFILVYLREAHPANGWSMSDWSKVSDPTSWAERSKVAGRCCKEARFEFTTVVDAMDDRTAVQWAGWPERLFVVDKQGKVVYAGQQGPWGFWPTDRRKRRGRMVRDGQSLEAFLQGYFRTKPRERS